MITITQFSLFGIEFRVLFVLNLFHFHGCRPRLRAITLDCPPWQRRFYFLKSNLFQMATRNWVKQLNLRKPTRLTLPLNQRKHYLTHFRTPNWSYSITKSQNCLNTLHCLSDLFDLDRSDCHGICSTVFSWLKYSEINPNAFWHNYAPICDRCLFVTFLRHLMAPLSGYKREGFRNVFRPNRAYIPRLW